MSQDVSIKELIIEIVKNYMPIGVYIGIVDSISPLKIKIVNDNNLVLVKDMLLFTREVKKSLIEDQEVILLAYSDGQRYLILGEKG